MGQSAYQLNCCLLLVFRVLKAVAVELGNAERAAQVQKVGGAQISRLQAQHTQVRFLMAKDEGHGYQKKPNRDNRFYATDAFLEANLLGGFQ